MLLFGSVNLAHIVVGLVQLYGPGPRRGVWVKAVARLTFFLKKRIVSRAQPSQQNLDLEVIIRFTT